MITEIAFAYLVKLDVIWDASSANLEDARRLEIWTFMKWCYKFLSPLHTNSERITIFSLSYFPTLGQKNMNSDLIPILDWQITNPNQTVETFLSRPAFDEKAEAAASKCLADIRTRGLDAVLDACKAFAFYRYIWSSFLHH